MEAKAKTSRNGITKENLSYCMDLLNVKYDPQEYHRTILGRYLSIRDL